MSIRRSDRLDEEVHEAVLDDGLTVKVIPRPGYHKKIAMLTTDYGSADSVFSPPGEDDVRQVPQGIAHFLEHKLFEAEGGQDVLELFATLGASANAHTTCSETSYYFHTTSRFEPCLDLLMDFVFDPLFSEEHIEKERGVIAQEIRMYDDDADSRGHLQLMQALYHQHPVRIDIPGTVETIQQIDRDLLMFCHRAFYRPENMVLVAAGDIDPQSVLDQAAAAGLRRKERLGDRAGRAVCQPIEEPTSVFQAQAELAMPVSLPRLLVGYKDAPAPHGPARLRRLLEAMVVLDLLFGRSSAFYEEHYAKGLIDGGFGPYYMAGARGFAYGAIGGESPRPDDLVGEIEARLEAAKRDGLEAADFTRFRNKAYGGFVRGLNSVDQRASVEVDAHFAGYDLLTDYLSALETISLDDLQRLLEELFVPERRAVTLVRPLE
jgi:predicted Zn-dependent peptidase